MHALWSVAVLSTPFLPIIVESSINASTSSLDWNKGNFLVKKNRKMIPADQTSIAGQRMSSDVGGRENRRAPTSGLKSAFEQDFWCSEATRTSSVRLRMWPTRNSYHQPRHFTGDIPSILFWITNLFRRKSALLSCVLLCLTNDLTIVLG